jgi:hypothetical protein
MMKKYPFFSLFLANLVPLPGLFFLDWDIFSILFFYWLESAVVGIYNIPRMLLAYPGVKNKGGQTGIPRKSHRISGIVFFCIHYSGFMAGHGFFIFELFSPVKINLTTVILGVLFLAISHGVSYKINFLGHKEYEKISLSEQMIAPYKRIFLMHITIILCAFLLELFSMPQITLVLLVFLKIIIDVVFHFREHSKLGAYFNKRGNKWFGFSEPLMK